MKSTSKRAVIYARVSTDDQNCDRQLQELRAFAERAGYTLAGTFIEKASGTKENRKERAKVLALAKAREIDTILVTELSRWGRSTPDLLNTLDDLNGWNVSVVSPKGSDFDLSTANGKMFAGILAVLSEFERNLLSERTKSGLAAAALRGKKPGRPRGHRSALKHKIKVLSLLDSGRSYRQIAAELRIGKGTVMEIAKAR